MQSLGWHPYIRQTSNVTFRPDGEPWTRASALIKGPGAARVGRGVAFKAKKRRIRATIIVIWAAGQSAPWIILTDLAPESAGASWYALRFWIEVGFKALKSVGWQWQKTRRVDPARVERHWLVLSISTLYALADVAKRLASAGAVAAPARRSGGHMPPQNPKHTPVSPSREKGQVGFNSSLIPSGYDVPAFARMTLLGDSGFPPSRE